MRRDQFFIIQIAAMTRLHRHLSVAVLLSECSHVFCCVLPSVVTLLSLATNLGLMTVMPGFLLELHEAIHHYELAIIVFSGVVLAVGWIVQVGSSRVDCHDHGCHHPPCDPRKKMNGRILIVASILFGANIFIYAFVHKNVLNLPYFEVHTALEGHEHGEKQEN